MCNAWRGRWLQMSPAVACVRSPFTCTDRDGKAVHTASLRATAGRPQGAATMMCSEGRTLLYVQCVAYVHAHTDGTVVHLGWVPAVVLAALS
jgi:hypothetical protein